MNEAEPGRKAGREPERQCAVTRARQPAVDLIRFVRAPDGSIVTDLAGKLPGRGVWIACSHDVVAEAVRKRVFSRALKEAVEVPGDLADRVDALLLQRAVSSLSLANKAGEVLTGFSKVERAVEARTMLCLIHASDAADDGVDKLERKHKAIAAASGANAPPSVRLLTVEQLSLALGRPNVVHAALGSGGASRKFLRDAERLLRYRGQGAASEAAA